MPDLYPDLFRVPADKQTDYYLVVKHAKELYILTGMETRQLFRRMFVSLKKFKELFGVFNFSRFKP